MWRLLIFIPIWTFYLLSTIPLYLLGWIMVPIAAICGAYREYDWHDGHGTPRKQVLFTWKIMKPWSNREDGEADTTYWKAPYMWMQIIYWDCYRNPVSGLRWTPPFSCMAAPAQIRFVGSILNCPDSDWNWLLVTQPDLYKERIMQYDTKTPQWFLCWQGWRGGLYWQFMWKGELWRFWSGWKHYPSTVYYVPEYQKDGVGFALQLKRVIRL
jgi:hypothetical protein